MDKYHPVTRKVFGEQDKVMAEAKAKANAKAKALASAHRGRGRGGRGRFGRGRGRGRRGRGGAAAAGPPALQGHSRCCQSISGFVPFACAWKPPLWPAPLSFDRASRDPTSTNDFRFCICACP